VQLTYELEQAPGGGVTIKVQTNLPEGAELGGSFFREGGFFAQDEDVVNHGAASFGPFTDSGAPLVGTYEMSVTLPIARNQPEAVQECIGTGGELLTGPLVSTHEPTGDQVASVDVPVTFQ